MTKRILSHYICFYTTFLCLSKIKLLIVTRILHIIVSFFFSIRPKIGIKISKRYIIIYFNKIGSF